MSNENRTQNMIGYFIDGASAFCSLTGITIFKILAVINPTFLQYKHIWYLIIVLGIVLRYQIYVIPKYQIEKQDKPQEEAKASCFTSALIILAFSVSIIIQCVNLHNNSVDVFADNIPNTTTNDGNNISNDNDIINHEDSILTPLDKMIEEYILYAEDVIIPIDELESLSDSELYYIRNGIFAYAGQTFESGYYERFSWYIGNISNEDIWSIINHNQLENINNIKQIENQRKHDG